MMSVTRRPWLWLASPVVTVVVFVACTGADPDLPDSQGRIDGPCFANGTCNFGLECVGGRCQAGDGGPTGDGSGGSDATAIIDAPSTVDGGDSPVTPRCDAGAPGVPRVIPCGATTCNVDEGNACCASPDAGASACVARGNICPSGTILYLCSSYEDCATGDVCCLQALAPLSSTCPATTTSAGATCVVESTGCQGGQIPLCLKDDQCPAPKLCRLTTITGADQRSVGACQ